MRGRKSGQRIPDSASDKKDGKKGILLTIDECKIFGIQTNMHDHPYVNLKYFDSNYECLSAWEKDELKLLSDFIQKVSDSNWFDIQKSCTKHPM